MGKKPSCDSLGEQRYIEHARRRNPTSIPVHKIVQQPKASVLTLFWVKLHREQIAGRNGTCKRPQIHALTSDQRLVTRHGIVAVYKVKPAAIGDTVP